MFKRVAGTKDILPPEVFQWQEIEARARRLFAAYAYEELRTPLIEELGLYHRSLGEFTEIVQKQMFVIHNKEESYVLRPEGTASAVRAYLEHSLDKTEGLVKFYYLGPMFRLERPQKGRLRQFHHIGAEVIGSAEPEVDVEVVSLAGRLLSSFGISGYQIQLNTLGCPRDKKKLLGLLYEALKGQAAALCQECRQRLAHNVLRILDCKNEKCQALVRSLGLAHGHLCQECLRHFATVKKGLEALSVSYEVNPYLVRGLDYYTRTVFEIKHCGLGAQDAIGAGGRYDNLVKELGGPDCAAMGFAFGVERLLLALPREEAQGKKAGELVYMVSLGEEAKLKCLQLADVLRRQFVRVAVNLEPKSLKSQMRKANDMGARYALIVGDDELKQGVALLKDMSTGEQKPFPLSGPFPFLPLEQKKI